MTDTQIVTLALTLLGIFAASWFNNSRLSDVRDLLRAELKAERSQIEARFDRLEMKLEKIEDNIARFMADVERRLAKLESK